MSSASKPVSVLACAALGALALSVAMGGRAAAAPKPGPLGPANTLPGTAFTYQGALRSDGAPVNGSCDFQFELYDAPSGGAQVGTTQTATALTVTNGLFSAAIDFGPAAISGEARWLATAVRCPSGAGAYTDLSPRQSLSPSPMALALPGLWTQQNAGSPNLIGGYSGNFISSTVSGAVIAGGGGSGYANRIRESAGTIGGGYNNEVMGYGDTIGGGLSSYAGGSQSTVGGGFVNAASADLATVSGGSFNTASGGNAAVGGGLHNTSSGDYAAVGGGSYNTASSPGAAIGGGYQNNASSSYSILGWGYDTVGGGYQNAANGGMSTVAGGYHNTATLQYAGIGGGYENYASGYASAIPGGALNIAAGDYSFAAGRGAHANYAGTFVWSDTTGTLGATASNQFMARATGGFFLYPASGGCSLATGAGGWSCSSDRTLKENFAAVDGKDVLAKLSRIPISRWNSVGQDPTIQHVGPMAQDFHAAFGLGEDDTHINTVDAQGIALAAIQGLDQVVQEKDARITQLERDNAALKARMEAIDARLATVERGAPVTAGASPLSPGWLIVGCVLLAGLALGWRFGRKPQGP